MHSVVPSVEDLINPSSKADEICTYCNKVFKGSSALKRHLRRSHLSNMQNEMKFSCPVENCNYSIKNSNTFSSFAAVKQHYKLVHNNDRFKCQQCSRVFKSKYNCKKHEIECGIRYLCSCNIEYTTKRGLLKHIERQKHQLPPKLKTLFEAQSRKPEKKTTQKSQIIRTARDVILPKTLKSKVRVFRMTPNALSAVTKSIATNNLTKPLQLNAKNLSITNIPRGASIVLPGTAMIQKSQVIQSPPTINLNDRPPVPVESATTQSNLVHDWALKNISIQTEQSYSTNQWLSDSDVDKLLSENIGTQTIESVFDQSLAGTFSTLSQTDLCFDIGQDVPLSSLVWDQTCNNNQPITCDAQNQTVSEPLHLPSTDREVMDNFDIPPITCDAQNQTMSEPLHLPTTDREVMENFDIPPVTCDAQNQTMSEPLHLPTIDREVTENFDIPLGTPSDSISSLYASIETQTDANANNFLSAQTQTHSSIDFQQQTCTEADPFDVLNDIETQTDFLLPTLATSPSMFVHNCTQTSEPDILDRILELH